MQIPWLKIKVDNYLDLLRCIIGDRPPLWALIIGINDYFTMTKLNGAVPDADAMNDYLQTDLKVRSDQIVNLRNEQATRQKIIAAFKDLRENPRIKYHDPILIYFAGHGGEIPSKNMQTLIPVDYVTEQMPPIPDRTVAALINGISRKHGNNITVILDCCHSGSGTRGDEETDGSTVRGCELSPNDVPDNLDERIRKENPEPKAPTESGNRALRFPKGFAVKDMNSHVLLAACSANELAREDKKDQRSSGRFTSALLELFRTVPPGSNHLCRRSVQDTPHRWCEGFYRNRILFDAKVRPPTRQSYEVKLDKRKYILEAGRAHGVTDGAEFTLYRNREVVLSEEPLGVMIAKEQNIKPFATALEPVNNTTVRAFEDPVIAIQTKAGASQDLLIHVPLESKYMPVFEAVAREMSGTGPDLCRIKLVERSKAKLEIVAVGKSELTFNVLEKRATEHGFTRMPHVVGAIADDLQRILRAAGHYHFHLNLNHPNNLIKDSIQIEFFPLREEYSKEGEEIYTPEGKNMLRGGRIEYEVDEHTKYGMKISNNTPWDLYFSCFFFDHADFSITALTEVDAQTRYQKDYSLKSGSVIDIGYGDSSIPPFECDVPQGLDLTIGFLKFYFTSEVVDLSHVPQVSPFCQTRAIKVAGRRKPQAWDIQVPAGTSANAPKPPRRSLFQRLLGRSINVNLNLRKDTIVLPVNVPPKPLPESSWFNGLRPRPISALIIGINDYQHLPKLQGAVNDADTLSNYLQNDLKVPTDCIINLRNQEASRAEILKALNALRSARTPRKEDSIIIYFSGYGGPLDSSINGVQTIVPWDYSVVAGNEIPAVTSSELLSLLAEIKRNKGDHITIIFDCGGSSQKVQNDKDGLVSSRVIDIASGEGAHEVDLVNSILSGNVFTLSACSRGEAAREVRGHGLFTSALIKHLKRQGSTNTTRSNVLARLPQIPNQTPQAYGGTTDVPLFDTGLVPPEQIAYNISEDNQKYIVHAGSVAGITPGALFSVYRDKSRLSQKKPKAFIADRVALFTTTLKPLEDQPFKPLLNSPSVIPAGSGQQPDLVVAVAVPLKDALAPLYQAALKLLYNAAADTYQVLFTEQREKADIFVDLSEDGKSFTVTILDERASRHGYTRFPSSVPLKPEDIERFFRNASHFYRHLNRSYLNTAVGSSVSVEFLKLEDSDTEYDDDGHPYRYPVGSDLSATGVVEVEVDPEEPEDYGFRLTNNSDQDLYPHIFYFDNTNYYPRGSEQTPIKKGGGELTIGFDNPGTNAYSYFIRDGQDIDVGFIKVLFSTEPVTMQSIPQTTAFQEAVVSGGGKQKVVEGKTELQSMSLASEKDLSSIWGSSMFCIVQRRVPEEED
ncbi:hypothetical protein H1R20_g10256, partial [Candolleomyces eurysporus]